MPRENSFSDDEGRSLTPDLEEEMPRPVSPQYSEQEKSTSAASQAYPTVLTREADQARGSSSSIHAEPEKSRPSQSSRRPTGMFAYNTPKERFRACVRKIIQMHRTSTMFVRYGAGAEPGVDPRRQSAYLHYGHIRENCVIEMAEYSSVRTSFGRMTNKEFIDLLGDPIACQRESWVKVRWINIGGISWDVMSALALKFDLHPLALEDVLHQRGHSRSKSDYYTQHLFIRVLSHTLGGDDEDNTSKFIPEEVAAGIPRASSPAPMTSDIGGPLDEEHTFIGSASASGAWAGVKSNRGRVSRRRRFPFSRVDVEAPPEEKPLIPSDLMSRKESASRRRREKAQKSLEKLKKGERVNVKVQPMFIFLLRNGTVISIHPQRNLDVAAPIMSRLRQPDTTLRTSADASLLVQSLLDLVVDSALEVVDTFHEKILSLEHDVLLRPNMKVVRHLHILSGDLKLLKRTMEPIKTVIYGLRRYDVDRCAALVEHTPSNPKAAEVVGFMSHKSKIYLADVHDHMEYMLSSLDMFAGIAENLIDYTFNMASYEMNEVMRRLTMATIIFLPLTLLTGYFGMNFDSMWSLRHTDLLFWEIALPVMAIVVPIFVWPDIRRMAHYAKKRFTARQTVKVRLD
ncbi:hypothetical protein SERLA73DRAFT_63839 [Serpula lacrymans var. lacrymans S7.3]|uniref:Magnesium transport protein CorA n=1 Tax=Serpula lacrymans var. lacrymans (strain S7.3) TaxID=936435 RepID=F8QDQ0_SERL3|nr:hypothetical protein SERLA73DRAFT_63839 [Serpula lacrymans var. lacrymans S7.3]